MRLWFWEIIPSIYHILKYINVKFYKTFYTDITRMPELYLVTYINIIENKIENDLKNQKRTNNF